MGKRDGGLESLPKWAQEKIRKLEERVQELEKRSADVLGKQGEVEPGDFFDPYPPLSRSELTRMKMGSQPYRLCKGMRHVALAYGPDAWSSHLLVRAMNVSSKLPGPGARDTVRLVATVTTNDAIHVIPNVRNSVDIAVSSW
jgi:hypothetical protein